MRSSAWPCALRFLKSGAVSCAAPTPLVMISNPEIFISHFHVVDVCCLRFLPTDFEVDVLTLAQWEAKKLAKEKQEKAAALIHNAAPRVHIKFDDDD